MTQATLHVPAAGPMFDGHFPGSPILPGARLLDLILQAMRIDRAELQTVKFLGTVTPASELRLQWSHDGAGRIQFECRQPQSGQDGGRLIASGKLRAL